MLFYLIMGGLFTIYAFDLLILVIISAIARAREVQAAMSRKRQRKREAKRLRAETMGPGAPKAATFAFGNESMVGSAVPAIKTGQGKLSVDDLKPSVTEVSATDLSPATPLSTPEAPPCPEPHQRLANTMSNVSSFMEAQRDEDQASSARAASSCAGVSTKTTSSSEHPLQNDDAPTSSAPMSHHSHSSSSESVGGSTTSGVGGYTPADYPAEAHTGGASTPSTAPSNIIASANPMLPYLPGSTPSTSPSSEIAATEVQDDAAISSHLTPSPTGQPPTTVLTPTAPTAPTANKPYGWGFGWGLGRASSSLPSSGGSGISLPSSGGSGISADMVINMEMPGQIQMKKALSFKEGMEHVEEGTELAWPLPLDQYPLVLIQVPMFNEEAHAALIIERCCEIQWPRTRLLIQVLDDSTKQHIRERVDEAAVAYMEQGHPVQVLRRTNRQGYKAGAMVAGLEHVAPIGFKYCAIFDADFEPPKDFLLETIGPLESDDALGFVQTRWVNPHKSFLTWAQKVNLGFHFDVEQRARSFMGWFFNFNGTAGVWRIQAIESAGGWEIDTVVEDMDLSLRAYLAGWRGLYLPHVGCINEVPDDLSTYKTQQYRWLCGPMQILSKAFMTIWRAKNVPLRLRLNCYWFFARYVLFAIITLAVLVVPPVALWLDPWHWVWPEIFFCVSINFALAVYMYVTPWSIAYMLFSVATGYFKAWAMLGGLLGSKKSKSWKVTTKKGAQAEGGPLTLWQRTKDVAGRLSTPYGLELALSVYYVVLAALAFAGVGLPGPSWLMGGYTAIMSVIFFVISFGDAFM